MRYAGITDFLFTGLALLPAVLLLFGHAGPAMLLFVPLLIAACLSGLYQQQVAEPESADTQPQPDAAIAPPGEPRQI
jgi:hypothetical protein